MYKNIYYISVLCLSLIANCLSLYTRFKVGYSYKNKEIALVNSFGDKEVNELSLEFFKVNPYEQLLDLKGDSIILNSIINDAQKLILLISDNSCGSCTEHSLNALQRNASQNLVENILILGFFENKREFFLLSKQYPFKFFLLQETGLFKDISIKSPVFFLMDYNFRIKSAFFPVLEYQILTEKYLEHILKIINR